MCRNMDSQLCSQANDTPLIVYLLPLDDRKSPQARMAGALHFHFSLGRSDVRTIPLQNAVQLHSPRPLAPNTGTPQDLIMAVVPTLFCNSLRRRPSYASAIPTLLAQAKYDVRGPFLLSEIAVQLLLTACQSSYSTRTTSLCPLLSRLTHALAFRSRPVTSASCCYHLPPWRAASWRRPWSASNTFRSSQPNRLPLSSC